MFGGGSLSALASCPGNYLNDFLLFSILSISTRPSPPLKEQFTRVLWHRSQERERQRESVGMFGKVRMRLESGVEGGTVRAKKI